MIHAGFPARAGLFFSLFFYHFVHFSNFLASGLPAENGSRREREECLCPNFRWVARCRPAVRYAIIAVCNLQQTEAKALCLRLTGELSRYTVKRAPCGTFPTAGKDSPPICGKAFGSRAVFFSPGGERDSGRTAKSGGRIPISSIKNRTTGVIRLENSDSLRGDGRRAPSGVPRAADVYS